MKCIPYAKQSISSGDIKAVTDALKSDYITQGPRVYEFERKVADYCGARFAVAVNSGTSALHAACFAADIKYGDEVVTSAISFAASSNCVLYRGGVPRFADILADTATIDPYMIKKCITRKTRAIIPVDFAGHPAELMEIKRFASKYNITIIEDAAHALGAEYRGDKVGSCKYSDMTILSFHAVKHITTGEGGMVLTNSKDLYNRLIMFRNHGITREKERFLTNGNGPWYYEMQFLGFNYRITDIQCALGLSQMKRIYIFVKRRREIAQFYKEEFDGIKDITCLCEKEYAKSSWHIFPVRIKNRRRDMIFNKLRDKGIAVNVHYIPIYLHPYYRKLGYKRGLCPKAEGYYQETLTLPLYPAMSISDARYVAKSVKEALRAL